jgi:hypothetical protein
MHIASGLALVRREPAQSDLANGHPTPAPGLAWRWKPDRLGTTHGRLRKMLPGVILLTVLAALGAMFPILF